MFRKLIAKLRGVFRHPEDGMLGLTTFSAYGDEFKAPPMNRLLDIQKMHDEALAKLSENMNLAGIFRPALEPRQADPLEVQLAIQAIQDTVAKHPTVPLVRILGKVMDVATTDRQLINNLELVQQHGVEITGTEILRRSKLSVNRNYSHDAYDVNVRVTAETLEQMGLKPG